MLSNELHLPVTDKLVKSVIVEFERAQELINDLNDLDYRRSANGTGSVGGHFRHNLDFVNRFLNGIETGKIDYNQRERDIRVEEEREYAMERMANLIGRLSIVLPRLSNNILVRSEVDEDLWLPSTVARELEFLYSHTVHHHAMIAEKLAGRGILVMENFGVAVSTVKFWDGMNARKAASY